MNELIRVNDEMFLVRRKTGNLYEKFAHAWNDISPSHKTFKKDGYMYFCELIEEAQIED
jgi:hypothetical protein